MNSSNRIKKNENFYQKFKVLQFATRFAGIISVIQSIFWIGFSICGILLYYCFLDSKTENTNFESIAKLTFLELYFHNDGCIKGGYENNNTLILKYIDKVREKTTVNSSSIFYGMCIVIVLNTLWLLISVSLTTKISHKHLKRTNILLYLWVLITLTICVFDIAFSVIFGLDFIGFYKMLSSIEDFNQENMLLFVIDSTAMISSIVFFLLSIRGFALWLLNIYFTIYLFAKTFTIINAAEKMKKDDDRNDTHSVLSRPPIRAYEPNGSLDHVHLNVEPLERAYRMSRNALDERRRSGGISNPLFIRHEEGPSRHRNSISPRLPDPDYTPPISPQTSHHRQVLRNERFQ